MSAYETSAIDPHDEDFATMDEIIEALQPTQAVMRRFLREQYNVFAGPDFDSCAEARLFYPPLDAKRIVAGLIIAETADSPRKSRADALLTLPVADYDIHWTL